MVASRLGIRSAYSLLYGTSTPADIAAQAATYGAKTLAITDRDNLYGLHSIVESCRQAGLKPVIGAEITVADGFAPSARGQAAIQISPSASIPPAHNPPIKPAQRSVFVFAQTRGGFSRLCELLSLAKAKDAAAAGFNPVNALRDDSGGLALATSSPELLEALAGRVPTLYAAVTPSSVASVRTAARLGVPLAALDDATLLQPGDRAMHAVLRAIALGKTTGSLEPGDTAGEGELFLTADEFERRLGSWPEALRHADELASSCSFDTVFDGFVFPEYRVVMDCSTEGDCRDPADILRARVMTGARRRYGELSDAIAGRIDYELGIIGRKGFAPYFLVMDDIVSMSRRTCGRGSGAASIVAYCLGITNVDPIAYNLYFERFLTLSRPDPPDIDVDFAWDERHDLMRRVIERFGSERCARVANHNLFRTRSAFRECAKAYGFADGEISMAERRMFTPGGYSALSAPAPGEPWNEILDIARRLEGLPRGLSTHCGGLVIAPGPIRRYAPVELSADGFPLLAWEKEGVEAAGLVKLDLLGNRSLAVIRDALAMLRAQGIDIDETLWRPAEDMETIAALARGDSMGVFYIESPAMRQLQRKTGAGDFDHIVIHSSMIRPAANKLISEYVRRLKGKPWKPLHQRLAGVLDETYGIVCYQEDVSKVAIALAGFGEDDADRLRKVISKKAGAAKLAEYQERFFSGCARNGVDVETTKTAWSMLLSFEGYSFCKPHSASYAMVSFQSAWLRVHYPAEFMAAVLSNQGGYYRPQAYISEARRMGLSVAGPDMNLSAWHYSGSGSTLVVGFMAIAGLSRSAADAITAERDSGGPYASLADFSRRMGARRAREPGFGPARDDLVALLASGSFDSISEVTEALPDKRSDQESDRQHIHANRAVTTRAASARANTARLLLSVVVDRQSGRSGQTSLFEPETGPDMPANSHCEMAIRASHGSSASQIPDIAGGRRIDRELHGEFEVLGFLRNHHPLVLWSASIAARNPSGPPRIMARDIPHHVGRRVTLIGWPVTQKEVMTSGGLIMDFVSLEDETALYETVFFPEAYARYRHLLLDQRPLVVHGLVTEDQGALSVEVQALAPV